MNHNSQKKASFVQWLLPVLLILLIGSTLALSFIRDFDADIGHFASDSPFYIAFSVLCGAAILCGIVNALLGKKSGEDVPSPSCSGFAAWLFSGASALTALLLFGLELRDLLRSGEYSLPELGEMVLLPGIAAFFILGILPAARGSKAHGVTGILACLSVNCLLFAGYFDFTLPLNSPVRNALVLMEAAFLLSLLFASGHILGKSTRAAAFFVKTTAVPLMGGIAFGIIIAAILEPQSIPDGVSVLRCALCLFAAGAILLQYPIIPSKKDTASH